MFTQCFKCQLCKQADHAQLKFLSVMKRNASTLLILDQPRSAIKLTESQLNLIPFEFDEEYVNEITLSTIGGILFAESDDFQYMDRIFSTLKDVEITYAVRCMTNGVAESNTKLSCGIYTKTLLMNRSIIVTGRFGYEQMAEYLPFSPALPEYASGKMFRTQYGVIVTIDPPDRWSESDVRRVGSMIIKAKKEVGLDSA